MQLKNKLQNDTTSRMGTQSGCKLLGDTNICFPSSVPNDDNLLTFDFPRSVPNNETKFNYCWRSHID